MVDLRSGKKTRAGGPRKTPTSSANRPRFSLGPEGEEVKSRKSARKPTSSAKAKGAGASAKKTPPVRKAATRGKASTPARESTLNAQNITPISSTPTHVHNRSRAGTPAKSSTKHDRNRSRAGTPAKSSTKHDRNRSRAATPAKPSTTHDRNRSRAYTPANSSTPVKPLSAARSSTPRGRSTPASSSTTADGKSSISGNKSPGAPSNRRSQGSGSSKRVSTRRGFLRRGSGDRRRQIMSSEKLKSRRPSVSFRGTTSMSSSDSGEIESAASGPYEWPKRIARERSVCTNESGHSSESEDVGSISAYAITGDDDTDYEEYISSSMVRHLSLKEAVGCPSCSDREGSEDSYELEGQHNRSSSSGSISRCEITGDESGDEMPRYVPGCPQNFLKERGSSSVKSSLQFTQIDWSDDPTTDWSDSASDSSLERDVLGVRRKASQDDDNMYPRLRLNNGQAMRNPNEMSSVRHDYRRSMRDGQRLSSHSGEPGTYSRLSSGLQTTAPPDSSSMIIPRRKILTGTKATQKLPRASVALSQNAAQLGYWDGKI